MTAGGRRTIAFEGSLQTQHSAHEGSAAIAVGPAALDGLPDARALGGRVLVAAFEGSQRTAGYAIQVTGIVRDGDRLIVTAAFRTPPPGSVVAQVLTSPVHAVSIAAADAGGLAVAVLEDETGAERARVTLP